MTPSPLNPPSETAVAKDDYDTPWKDAVTRYFPEFIAFDFPDAHRQIDWHRGYTFLDQDSNGQHTGCDVAGPSSRCQTNADRFLRIS